MSETPSSSQRGRRAGRPRGTDGVEYWVRCAFVLVGLFALGAGSAWLRLGQVSLYSYSFGLRIVGVATVPIALWGIMWSTFRPPLFRWWRVAGFGALLVVGYLGNVRLTAAPVATADWQSDHTYRLPFEGTWRTLEGGPSYDRNSHAATVALRWGYDFAPVRDGRRHEGDGTSVEDYYCWNEPVYAPVGGEVVELENSREDREPRSAGSTYFGNHVVFRVAEDEFLYVGFLKKGSVPLEVGAEVERGERIGRCGNSGSAFEPRLHVHLQDRTGFPIADGMLASGLPLRFSNYRLKGEGVVERGMPKGAGSGGSPPGELVSNVDPE